MPSETVAVGADHAGFSLKIKLKEELETKGYLVLDFGTNSVESVDYPDFATAVARAIVEGKASRGVLVCGTGIGMSIAANRVHGVRAALVRCVEEAELSRAHNDANVLCLGARITTDFIAGHCLDVFLKTPFEGGRHARRVGKMD
jgi:ribose 5-phosphate isomerase B